MSNQFGQCFQIRSCLIHKIKKDYILSPELSDQLISYSNLIAIYIRKGSYNPYRLKYYKTDHGSIDLSSWDFSTKLIFKMKLISVQGAFDEQAEQELGLTMGIVSRVQRLGLYESKVIKERYYNDLKQKCKSMNSYDLVHLIALKTKDKLSVRK
jgi:hypothetical protein